MVLVLLFLTINAYEVGRKKHCGGGLQFFTTTGGGGGLLLDSGSDSQLIWLVYLIITNHCHCLITVAFMCVLCPVNGTWQHHFRQLERWNLIITVLNIIVLHYSYRIPLHLKHTSVRLFKYKLWIKQAKKTKNRI